MADIETTFGRLADEPQQQSLIGYLKSVRKELAALSETTAELADKFRVLRKYGLVLGHGSTGGGTSIAGSVGANPLLQYASLVRRPKPEQPPGRAMNAAIPGIVLRIVMNSAVVESAKFTLQSAAGAAIGNAIGRILPKDFRVDDYTRDERRIRSLEALAEASDSPAFNYPHFAELLKEPARGCAE